MGFQSNLIKNTYTMQDLREIIRILRGEGGCPWDREQTHETIAKNFLEETYETLEAIEQQDPVLLQEELGDVLLQIVFHTQIEEELNHFSFEEVVTGICKKLIHRHPHVFSIAQQSFMVSADEVLQRWEEIKKEEKKQISFTETLEDVPKILPALMRCEKIQHRAQRAGVNFSITETAREQMIQRFKTLQRAIDQQDIDQIDLLLGKIIFDCVNVSRFFQLNCEKSLTNVVETFINRFRKVEQLSQQDQIDFNIALIDFEND